MSFDTEEQGLIDKGRSSIEARVSYLEGLATAQKSTKKANVPLVAAIVAATIGLVGQAGVAWLNAKANRDLESQKLQQQLLLNAVAANVDQSKENLEFLLDTQLLRPSEQIDTEAIREELDAGKILSVASGSSSDVSELPYRPTANPQNCNIHLKWGYPSKGDHILCRRAFAVSYDVELNVPLWVSYKLDSARREPVTGRRNIFQRDPALPAGVGYDLLEIFRGSGFDRGHLVSSGDVRWDSDSEYEANFSSNITPQYPEFNRGIWFDTEMAVREWLGERGVLFVISGPVFDPGPRKLLADTVAIPDQFFKILFDPSKKEAIAFLIPHRTDIQKGADLRQYLIGIGELENLTGLDFLSALDDDLEMSLERSPAQDLW